MANAEAFNSGFDAGMGKKEKGSPKQFTGNLASSPTELHKGGVVKKTGNYRLRKKELVLTVGQQKALGLKKSGKKKSGARKRVSSKG